MNKQDRKYLKRLLETPSPTGCEQRIAAMVRERMEGVADQVTTDVMGSVHARLAGRARAVAHAGRPHGRDRLDGGQRLR